MKHMMDRLILTAENVLIEGETKIKDAYYFPHDSNAHKDPKILGLRLKCGMEGVGIFWTLIELLRDSPTYKYPHDLATLELGLSLPQARLEATLKPCFELGLLVKKDGFFSSPSLDRRMAEVDARIEILREAGRRGGQKSSQAQARLKPGSSQAQAGKESKVKESKVKERKECASSKTTTLSPSGDFPEPSVKDTTKPQSDVKVLIEVFFKELTNRLGEPPASFNGGAAGRGFKNLLAKYPLDEIKQRIAAWFQSDDPFWVKESWRVELFVKNFNALKNGVRMTGEVPWQNKYIAEIKSKEALKK